MKYRIHIQLSVKHSTLTSSFAAFITMERRDNFDQRHLVAGFDINAFSIQIYIDAFRNLYKRYH